MSKRGFVFMYLMCSQSTDSKNWWFLISSTLTAPTLFSASVQYLKHTNSRRMIQLSNKPLYTHTLFGQLFTFNTNVFSMWLSCEFVKKIERYIYWNKNAPLHTLISSLWPSLRWGLQVGRRGFPSSSSPSCMSPVASQSRTVGNLNTANKHLKKTAGGIQQHYLQKSTDFGFTNV